MKGLDAAPPTSMMALRKRGEGMRMEDVADVGPARKGCRTEVDGGLGLFSYGWAALFAFLKRIAGRWHGVTSISAVLR